MSQVRSETLPSNAVARREPLPGSKKVYAEGPAGLRVPFREIALTPSRGARGEAEIHPPLRVYDTSGPYTDPRAEIDLERGLPELRRPWILARGEYDRSSPRRTNAPGLALTRPREVLRGRGVVTQMSWARRGVVDARDGVRRDPGEPAGRARARRGRPRPRDHPRQHQPSRIRADDHRTPFPREDQREHRQLRRRVLDRRGGREDDVGNRAGAPTRSWTSRRGGTSTRRASGSSGTRRCRSERCRSIRRSKGSAARPRT